MKFLGPVNQIKYSNDGNLLAAASEEKIVSIFNFKKEKVYKCHPGHEASCLNISFNYSGKFLSSIGCDGFLNIYDITNLENIIHVKNLKIASEIKPSDEQILDAAW